MTTPYLWRSARLALGTAVALGFARFAYGLLLPAMRSELGWSLASSGAMTAANGLGYLAGALVTAALVRRLGAGSTFRLGMVLTVASLAGTTLPYDPLLMLARTSAGATGAMVFISGGVIASGIASGAQSTTPITVYYSGAGLGIALSGALIPPVLGQRPGLWPLAWAFLALAGLVATAVSWTAARTDTAERDAAGGRRRIRPLRLAAVAYVLFAAGYITYITFLSEYLTERNASAPQIALTWTVLGLSVVAAPAIWRRAMLSWRHARALATLLAVLGFAAGLALTSSRSPVIFASAVAYGVTFMNVPASITTLIRSVAPPVDWTRTLAAFTVLFAIGQTVGPWIAGALADRFGTGMTLAWTAVLCLSGAVLAWVQQVSTSAPPVPLPVARSTTAEPVESSARHRPGGTPP